MPSQSLWRPHHVVTKLLCTPARHLPSISLVRETASGHQGTRAPGNVLDGATPTVGSVRSSCLGRFGRAGFFPVLRLDQSSPAKPVAACRIAVNIPRREARSWSYSGLRHIWLQPQEHQGQRREVRSISTMRTEGKGSGKLHQRDRRQALLKFGIARNHELAQPPSHYGPRANLE